MINKVNFNCSWHKNADVPYLKSTEKPELLIICSTVFDLINELLLGPNLPN